MTLQFVDVSHWQDALPDLTGVSGVLARASFGTSYDTLYKTHIANARKAGLRVGAYHFAYNFIPIKEQALFFLSAASKAGVMDYYALDVEGIDSLSRSQTIQFIDIIQAAGHKIGLYKSESVFIDAGQDWDWIAHWGYEPVRHYDMWQYGEFHGVDGDKVPMTLTRFDSIARNETTGGGTLDPVPIPEKKNMLEIYDETPMKIDVAAGKPMWLADWTKVDAVDRAQSGVSWFGALSASGGHYRALSVMTGGKLQIALFHTTDIAIDQDWVLCPVPPAPVDTTPFDQSDIDAATAPLKAEITGLESEVAGLNTENNTLTVEAFDLYAQLEKAAEAERERIALAEANRIRTT